jgi:uncharacterized protein (DUF934 family)
MPLVRGGRTAVDNYVRIADDAPIPEGVPVLVTATRLTAEPALLDRPAPVGVIWPNNRKIEELEPYLDRLTSIALVFPSFRDGRAYSQARLLRERYGFEGELRATGQVLRDQFLFMLRAGFDAFEVTKAKDAEAFPKAIQRYTRFYQSSIDNRPVISRMRRARDTRAQPAPTLKAS